MNSKMNVARMNHGCVAFTEGGQQKVRVYCISGRDCCAMKIGDEIDNKERKIPCLFSMKKTSPFLCSVLRRRVELEDKAKVVASVWGTESLPH